MLELAVVVIVVILAFCAWLLWLCAKLLEHLRELSAWDLKRKLDLDYAEKQKLNPELALEENKRGHDALVEQLLYPSAIDMAGRRYSRKLRRKEHGPIWYPQ